MNFDYCVKNTQDWASDCFHCMSNTPSISLSFSPEQPQGIHIAFILHSSQIIYYQRNGL